MKDPKKEKKALSKWARFSTIAVQMGVTIYLGNLLGLWLDQTFITTHWEPIITLIAIFLSMYVVIRGVNQINK